MNEEPPSPDSSRWTWRIRSWFSRPIRDRKSLLQQIRTARDEHVLGDDALAMFEGVLSVSEMRVRDVMVPRARMAVVSREATPEEALAVVVESGHSRFPVIGEDRDEVVGILLAKDLLRHFVDPSREFRLVGEMRPVAFIPESKRLNVLLKDFRASRNHMAVVVDEYGGVAGLVTIEDVLEQIVGDIDDEHDATQAFIFKHDDQHFTVKGLTPIEDFNEYFAAGLDENGFDTIAGIVSASLGRLPERDDEVDLGGFHFKVLRADDRRVHLLRLDLAA